MIADHLGYRTNLRELRGRFTLSMKGATLADLISMADAIGLLARPLKLDLKHMKELALPAILHWDLNHFVVLQSVSDKGAVILDPGIGERRLSMPELSKHFTGIALELRPSPRFQKKSSPPKVQWAALTGRVQGLLPSLVIVLGLSLALQVFLLIAPFYMQWVVDQVLVSGDHELLTIIGLGFTLSLLLQVAISAVRGWTVISLSTEVAVQWMANVFAHLLRLPMSFFETRHLGDIVSRMASVTHIQRTVSTSFVEVIIDGMMAVVTLVIMLIYSVKLAAITAVAVLLYIIVRTATYIVIKRESAQQLVASAKQESHLLESIRGVQSLKLAGVEPVRRSVYANLIAETANHDVRISRYSLLFGMGNALIFGVERIIVVWVGALLAMESVFSLGMLIAYLAYKDQFASRVTGLIDKALELRMLKVHAERLADITVAEPEPIEGKGDGFKATSHTLVAEGIVFRYSDSEDPVIDDLSLTIEEGEAVAIVGASGCGKTTLAKLMLGLLKPQKGRILMGGTEITALGISNFRKNLGVVMQDDQLFAGSVIENIALGDPKPDLARVEGAATLAAIKDEIMAMPMGFNTLIGDMGAAMSGGQRQRVLLARALYRRPKILFLDEATSNLDVQREQMVNEAIRRMKITRVIIAHRPETIASADRVLVMHAGKIVQEHRRPPELQETAHE